MCVDLTLASLAVVNSSPFYRLVEVQFAAADAKAGGAAKSYEVGVIRRTPVPDLSPDDEAFLAALARRAWSRKRSLDTKTATSHAFVLPALLQVTGRKAAGLLDKQHELRTWLAKRFFEQHLKRHSKSRRKAPILWQLGTRRPATASGSTPTASRGDSLFRVQRGRRRDRSSRSRNDGSEPHQRRWRQPRRQGAQGHRRAGDLRR